MLETMMAPAQAPTRREQAMLCRQLAKENRVIEQARAILRGRVCAGEALGSSELFGNYLRMSLGAIEAERFDVLLLDGKRRLLAHLELFKGSAADCPVYVREVVKLALQFGAHAVVCAHGKTAAPVLVADSDRLQIGALRGALTLIDAPLLDYFLVARDSLLSCAEVGIV